MKSFNFQHIKSPEVKKISEKTNVKKAVRVDRNPQKLNQTGADIIAEPLKLARNCCLRQGVFLNYDKTTFVVPLDKEKPKKYDVLNYRPVDILTAFSKIYKKVIKNQFSLILISISFLLYQRTENLTEFNRL